MSILETICARGEWAIPRAVSAKGRLPRSAARRDLRVPPLRSRLLAEGRRPERGSAPATSHCGVQEGFALAGTPHRRELRPRRPGLVLRARRRGHDLRAHRAASLPRRGRAPNRGPCRRRPAHPPQGLFVDAYQVLEAWSIGADAVLLIAAALSPAQLLELTAAARELDMAVLVEIHEETELARAIPRSPTRSA